MDPILDRRSARDRAAVDVRVTSGLDEPAAVDDRDPTDAGGAWRSRRAWAVLVVVAIASLVADLASKSIAFATIAPVPVEVERGEVLDAFERDRRLVRVQEELAELNASAHSSDVGTRARIEQLEADLETLISRPGWESLLPPHQPVVVIPNVLELTLVLNPGAVFGIGAGARAFFIGFTLLAVLFVLWIFARWTAPRDWLAHASIGLFIGGGFGNLYDRILYACVRDFLHPLPNAQLPFSGGRPLWPYVSNVADALLIIGIAGLLLHNWTASHHRTARARAAQHEAHASP